MELTLVCVVSVAIIHCIILILDMQSAQYLRLSGIIANQKSFCVVAFSVSAACKTLIPHRLLKYSIVVFDFSSYDKKACSCLMSVGLFGGYGTV